MFLQCIQEFMGGKLNLSPWKDRRTPYGRVGSVQFNFIPYHFLLGKLEVEGQLAIRNDVYQRDD